MHESDYAGGRWLLILTHIQRSLFRYVFVGHYRESVDSSNPVAITGRGHLTHSL